MVKLGRADFGVPVYALRLEVEMDALLTKKIVGTVCSVR
jgi:hypothetical protein